MKHNQPPTMADATPLIPGLLDDIVIWEILVRLPPKALLRCRAVRRDWRRTTSTRGFLLAHHARQPTLLIASGYHYRSDEDIVRRDHILSFDRLATADSQLQLQHVAPLGDSERDSQLVASCDGLLLFSYTKDGWQGCFFCIYNPATRQHASLSLFVIANSLKFDDFEDVDVPTQVLGMYHHGPTGEYRILLYGKVLEIDDHDEEIDDYDEETDDLYDVCYIFALGSTQPSWNIGCPPEAEQVLLHGGAMTAVMFHGNLHWYIHQTETESNMIVVFDTTTESFRQMHVPVASNGFAYTDLFDLHGVLGMFSCNQAESNINISVLQDYESEVWTFKCKIELPVTEIEKLYEEHDDSLFGVVMAWDGELIVLVQFDERLLQIDMDGKVVATFHGDEVGLTKMHLKQTLVQHTFFPTLE